jgi:hypothetical protein
MPSGSSRSVFEDDPPSQEEMAFTPAQIKPIKTIRTISAAIRRRRKTSGEGLLDLGIWDMPSILGFGVSRAA